MSATQEDLEINKRLEWYHKAMEQKDVLVGDTHEKKKEKKHRSVPIESIMAEIQHLLTPRPAEGYKLEVCEREIKCSCSLKECNCDSDDFYSVISTKSDVGSNCMFLVEIYFHDKVVLSKKKNLKVFHIHTDDTGEETTVMEIVRTPPALSKGKEQKKKKQDEEVIDTHVRFYCQLNKEAIGRDFIEFPLQEGVNLAKQSIHFQFNYLQYS